MTKFGKVAVAAAIAFSVGAAYAADLDEYVQTDLVEMEDAPSLSIRFAAAAAY